MLVSSKKILDYANKTNTCVAQFNINNLEWAKYILEVANELSKPVILGVSPRTCKYMGGFTTIKNIVLGLIKDLDINIDISLHLDHGKTFEICKEAIDAGFTSVMIDASLKTLEENIEITKKVVDYAHKKGVYTEAEIGGIITNGIADDKMYAKVEDCIEFVNKTNVDSLAPAVGSVHGIYKEIPNIDTNKIKQIKESINIPLVLHGGTGLSDNILKSSISAGINKVNINTQLQIIFANELRNFLKDNKTTYDPKEIISSAESAMKEFIKEKIVLFSSNQ